MVGERGGSYPVQLEVQQAVELLSWQDVAFLGVEWEELGLEQMEEEEMDLCRV